MPPKTESSQKGFWRRSLDLYVDGFRNMSKTSRTLWIIIVVKLFIMFAILRAFFFPNIIGEKGSKQQQIEFAREQLSQ